MAKSQIEIVAEADKSTIFTRRIVNASRALVFDAFTKPEHLRQWMGPRALTMVLCEVDLRVGGGWRMVHRAPLPEMLRLRERVEHQSPGTRRESRIPDRRDRGVHAARRAARPLVRTVSAESQGLSITSHSEF
jgi:activator of Hsp90 ATPase-like protein